jgi:hypothetical protein
MDYVKRRILKPFELFILILNSYTSSASPLLWIDSLNLRNSVFFTDLDKMLIASSHKSKPDNKCEY